MVTTLAPSYPKSEGDILRRIESRREQSYYENPANRQIPVETCGAHGLPAQYNNGTQCTQCVLH